MSEIGQAPLGAEPVASGDSTPNSTPNTPSVASGPDSGSQTAAELQADGLYRVPGQDKPVKLSDYVRGFQSQATRASQRAAELERKLQEREAALARYEQGQRQQGQQGQAPAQPGMIQQLESLPYLSGKEAAQVVQSISAEINMRDQVLLAMAKQLQAIQQTVKPMYESSATTAFDTKINGWLQAGGYPQEYSDLAKELYLGYEPGPELDQEFPQILAQRIATVEAALDRKRKQAAEQARRNPFVPGKGGQAQPSKPFGLKPNNNARADADAIWEAIQTGQLT